VPGINRHGDLTSGRNPFGIISLVRRGSKNLSSFFLATFLAASPIFGADHKILFSETFETPLGERWKPVEFGKLTDYRIVTENSNACLKASANSTASAFATKVEIQPAPDRAIHWRWKISSCPTNGSEDKLATFDHTARIFVALIHSLVCRARSITSGRTRRERIRFLIIPTRPDPNSLYLKAAIRKRANG
jgi:hypothetical protein